MTEYLCAERATLSMYAKPVAERLGALPLVHAACEDPLRKPDAGNLPVRFDEGAGTVIGNLAFHSVSPLLLYRPLRLWCARQSLVSLVIRKETSPCKTIIKHEADHAGARATLRSKRWKAS